MKTPMEADFDEIRRSEVTPPRKTVNSKGKGTIPRAIVSFYERSSSLLELEIRKVGSFGGSTRRK